MITESIQADEALSAKSATAPRVSVGDIEDHIGAQYIVNLGEVLEAAGFPVAPELKLMTVCVLVLKNGWVQLGKSAPASAENFNAEKGEIFAYEDAVRAVWPLLGFALRDRLHNESTGG